MVSYPLENLEFVLLIDLPPNAHRLSHRDCSHPVAETDVQKCHGWELIAVVPSLPIYHGVRAMSNDKDEPGNQQCCMLDVAACST